MSVRVLFFAALREKVGSSELQCELQDGDTVSGLAARMLGNTNGILFAVNDEFAEPSHELRDGDTVAFIPPMAGG